MKIPISIILLGFTAIGSQIIVIREFLNVFYGNELSMGFILACWLFGGAIGSWFFGGFADRIKNKNLAFGKNLVFRFAQNKIFIFSVCQLLISLLLPWGIFLIRLIKLIFNIGAGEIIPFSTMAISSFIILIPLCSILGFMFVLSCKIYETKLQSASKIGMVYALEAMGAMIGGLLASFLLIRIFNSFEIMAIFSLLNIMAAFFLCARLRLISIFLALFFIGMFLSGSFQSIEKDSIKRQFKGYKVLTSLNSIYGNITLTERENQHSFFYNGLYLYTFPDKLSSEEAVHFSLLSHPNPQNVLLIGGGVGGLMEEIIKHSVVNIDYVELDPLIIKLARDYLPKEYYKPLRDNRVSIKNIDGRFFIKGQGSGVRSQESGVKRQRTKERRERTEEEIDRWSGVKNKRSGVKSQESAIKKYDCVIVHLGNPYTAQLNRYYTVEFFREVKKVLNPTGIISFGVSSSENYIGSELGDFLTSIYLSLKGVFPHVKIIPGDTAYFLACNKKGVLTYNYKLLMKRAKIRNVDIKYVREYYLENKLSKERITRIENALKKMDVKMNYDFKPISYYYDIVFWNSRFGSSLFKKIMTACNEEKIFLIALCFLFLIFLFGFFGHGKAVLLAVMFTGFSEIAFQILVLLSFQIIYGYMFYKLGLILTLFMVGLTGGTLVMIKIIPGIKKDLPAFILIQVAMCLYPLILILFFSSSSKINLFLEENILFPILPIIAGFIGGAQFPLANKIYLKDMEDVGRVAGLNYGMDLFGSCLGAILTSAFLIPIIGIYKTCILIAIMNLVVLILLIILKNKA